ncbi:hypothetical protein M501DRAFT_993461 [Patellaria atrata CBS 101060]|uniref:Presequence protease, mitochondrial n=1 Tax=Patellaria atrata CBS 101060 TaxID=1346257 RepID=A0A9P4VT49_9PEZI|nr:hypothetical protein M501DRAFT_993461 [Patellaria atrata CBS 101060]
MVMLRAVQMKTSAPRLVIPYLRSTPIRTCPRGYATLTDRNSNLKPGEHLHGFTLQRTKHVPELQLTAYHLQHEKTGAEYLHVAREDPNNVFSIGFKTNPPDDTGVPHILEHTTLCGSEKYPVRDPFFKMLPRSLSNFMNAFTSSDHTSYPFATTNAQDFKNLMSVYLDATLKPLLQEHDFTQEGWRIGPENPLAAGGGKSQDPEQQRLVFKGVVYNEMKGQMSDSGYLYYIRFQDHLFPDINNSGGDPRNITDLTHEQLKKFHADHYHPSNAKIFTYGDLPLEDHLQEIDRNLWNFERIPVDSDIKIPIDLSNGPLNVTVNGPIDPLVPADAQYKTSTTWALGDTSDVVEMFSLGVMTSLLTDGYGSPLYRNLIEAGLGTDWSPNSGFDPSGKQAMFSVGLNGVKENDVSKVKEAIFKTFEEVREQGFPASKVDGVLHQLELALKHKTANFGMGLMQRLKPGWFNGVDPFDSLAWQETVDSFKERYAKSRFLEDLLEKYLLNDKTLTFTMVPSETFGQALVDEETQRLASKILETAKQFSSEEEARKHLEKRELELLEVQENARNQDLSCLPTLDVKDIPRQKEKKEVRHSSIDQVKVQWREAPTNGLTYFRAVNILDLPDELRQLIPLFSDAVMRLGTKDKTMEQLEELIKLKTGGISVNYYSNTSPLAFQQAREGLVFSGYALDRNVPDMYELIRTVIQETHFDSSEAEKKIRELLQSASSGAINSIASSGHAFARTFAQAGLTPEALLREQTSGLTQVKLTTSLASRPIENSLSDIISKLKQIQSLALTNTSSLRVAINNDTESSKSNEAALSAFLSSLPTSTPSNLTTTASQLTFQQNTKTFFPLPYQVYYTALALPTVPYTHASSPALQLLGQLLTHNYLHPEIREKGGAYGGGATASPLRATFSYYSYRDPNPQNSLKVMQDAGKWAAEKEWGEREMREAKLSVFQGIDAPQSVAQEGMREFLSGVDDEMAQVRRGRLLDITHGDVKRVAEEFLVKGLEGAGVAVLGERKGWVDEGWEVRDLGMEKVAEVLGEEEM